MVTIKERDKMGLSKRQEEIINAPYNKVVVMSSAASGKTNLLTEKVRQLIRANINPRQIAVITFTNMAATELKDRLGEDYKEGLYIGTIHGLANYMLSVGGVDTRKMLNEEKFDELFEEIEKNPSCVRHLEWILLDEAQDSDSLQFKFLFDMINPDCFFVVGDYKQSIYQFKNGDPSLMINLSKKEGVKSFSMNENYRNGRRILDFAKRIISSVGLFDDSVAMRPIDGVVEEIPFSLDKIVEAIKSQGSPKNWAILTRTNQEISAISSVLEKNKIPFDTFKQGDLTKAELVERMEKNTVKLLTIHSSKGLAFDSVIVVGARFYPEEERNVCYVAATRARNKLIWMTNKKKKNPRQKIRYW